MLEWGILIAISIGVGRVAASDNQSSVAWGGLTLLMGVIAAMYIPLPFLRMLIAGAAGFALYIVYKIAANK